MFLKLENTLLYARFDELNLFVAVSVPAKANSPVLTVSTSSSITLQWEAVYRGSASITYLISWKSISDNSTGNDTTLRTTYTANHLYSNTAYVFKVAARNQAGVGLPSDEVILETGILNGNLLASIF